MTVRKGDPTAGSAAVVCGIGSWLPSTVVTNAQLTERLGLSDQWIRARTGISTRLIADRDTLTSDIAVAAGMKALRSSGDSHVQAVVLATATSDRPVPATAPLIATQLGLPGIAAFDISAACSGFMYGLAVASGLVASQVAERVLLIGADRMSTLVDPQDRATAPIFGDGAGAVVLRRGHAGEPGAIGRMVLGSDGQHRDLLTVRTGEGSPDPDDDPPSCRRGYLEMRGMQVFRHAIERMSEAATVALDAAGWSMKDVDRLVAHQANARVTSALAARLDFPLDQCASNIEHTGNTSAASIPILLAEAAEKGSLIAGHRVLLTAFGAGLTWGATTLVWPDLKLAQHDDDDQTPE